MILGRAADGEPISGGRRGLLKLRELSEMWLERSVRPHRKPATVRDYEAKLRLYILPTFGEAAAVAITRDEIAKWHTGMSETYRAANYALTVLSGLFNWGIDTGLLPKSHSNPARRIQKFEEHSRERFLSREELASVGKAIRELEIEERLSMYSAAALRLLIYTGARSGEIKSLRWEWVDLERSTIFLPTSKTGKKPIHLNPEAVAVLRGLIRIKGNPYVIVSGTTGEHLVSLRQPWEAVCERAGITGCRLHDLRHTFASFAIMGGLSLPEVGNLLGHKTPATTARYAHLADHHAKENAKTVGNALGGLLNRPDTDGDKVVPMRRPA